VAAQNGGILMKKTIRINGIPTAMFLFFAIISLVLLSIPFFLPGILENEPPLDMIATKVIAIATMAIPAVTGVVLFGFALYWYLFTLEVTPSQVVFSAPFHKTVVLAREEITAFGLISYYGQRDIRLYICEADRETVWAFFQQNPEKCKIFFGEKDYYELLETEEKSWNMAIGVYIFCRQPGVYLLPQGNIKSMKVMEQIINMKPTLTGSGCASLWSSTAGEFQ
jgi:hypothetical protein